MPDPVSFDELLAQVARVQQIMEETFRKAPPSKEKEILGKALEGVRTSSQEAREAFPRAVEALQKRQDELASSLARTEAEHAQAQARLQAALEKSRAAQQAAQAAQPLAQPEGEAPELKQAGPLGRELLSRLAAEEAAPGDDATPHDLWESWD